MNLSAFPNAVGVTVRRKSNTFDDLGDSTPGATSEASYTGVFEPQQFVERTDSRSPGVTSTAKVYLDVSLQLDADDEVELASGTTWRVVGGSSPWGMGTEIPVERVSDV